MDSYYRKLIRFSPFNTYFAFLDVEDYLADSLFFRHQVRVYFGDEFVSPSNPYRVIFCYVRKWDENRFQAAMKELPNKMLLCGYTDYLDVCLDIWRRAAKIRDEGRNSSGADGAAEQAE